MADFLQTYLQIIPASQKAKLLDVIRSSQTKVTDYNPEIIDALLSENYKKITSYEKQPESLSSESYNKTIASIYGDLSVLYDYMNTTDVFLLNNKILDMADFSTIESELQKLKMQIVSLSENMQSTKTTQVFIDTFISTSNAESKSIETEHLFTDRDGSSIENVALINTVQAHCSLPITWDVNALKDKNGVAIAKISYLNKPSNVEEQTSHIYKDVTNKNVINNTVFTLEKCIDESIETYWSETIDSDQKLKITTNNQTEYGFFVKFEITLDTPKIINGFSLKAFSKMPIEIKSIEVMKDINDDVVVIPLSDIENELITSNQHVKINPIVAKKILITLKQENYMEVTYSVRKSKLSSRKSWQEIKRIDPTAAQETFEESTRSRR